MEGAARAAEAKDVAAIQKHVARDYLDPQGNDYNGLRELLLFHFRRAETVTVFLRRTEVTVDGDEARVTTAAILARGRKGEHPRDLLPESADAYLFHIRFSKRDDVWLAVSARWESIGLERLL